MDAADRTAAVEIGESASELQHSMIAARRKAHAFGRLFEQRERRRRRVKRIFDARRRRRGIAKYVRQTEGFVALDLNLAGGGDARGDFRRALAWGGQQEIGRGYRRDVDHKIEAIDEGTR